MFQILLYNSNFWFLNLAKQINFQFYFYLDIVFNALMGSPIKNSHHVMTVIDTDGHNLRANTQYSPPSEEEEVVVDFASH